MTDDAVASFAMRRDILQEYEDGKARIAELEASLATWKASADKWLARCAELEAKLDKVRDVLSHARKLTPEVSAFHVEIARAVFGEEGTHASSR